MKYQAFILLGIVGLGLLYGVLCFSEGPMVSGSHDMVCILASTSYIASDTSLSLVFVLPFVGLLLIRPFLGFQQQYVSSLFKPPQARS